MSAAMAGYDYGNARVRARKGGLLGREDYEGLMGRDMGGLLSALGRTSYSQDVDDALARFDGMRALHEAIRRHEARMVHAVRRMYEGDAAEALELWVGRYDTANLVAVLRGQARSADPADIIALLVPAGRIDDATLTDLARQPSLRETVDRLVVWGLPSRRVAGRFAHLWPDVARRADATALETALLEGWAAEVDDALDRGVGGQVLRRVLGDEVDQANLLLVLRLHDDRSPASSRALADAFLAGGRLSLRRLDAALARSGRAEVVRELRPEVAEAWRSALDAWADGADAVAVEDAVDRARAVDTHRLFVRGDPLGIGIPVAYLSAVQVQSRNLRAIGRGAAHAIPRDLVRSRLVVLEDR